MPLARARVQLRCRIGHNVVNQTGSHKKFLGRPALGRFQCGYGVDAQRRRATQEVPLPEALVSVVIVESEYSLVGRATNLELAVGNCTSR